MEGGRSISPDAEGAVPADDVSVEARPGSGKRSTDVRVLFVPLPDEGRTSERTPTLYRLMRERFPVLGLASPRDRLMYDPSRARLPRFLLYLVDKVLLFLRGVVIAHRFRTTVVFCETAHHAVAGLAIARVLGVSCVWDSHGNGKLLYEALGKDRLSIRFVETLERFLGAHVNHLITVTDVDAAAYTSMGLPKEKVHVIPSCVRLRELDGGHARPAETVHTGPPSLLLFGSFRYEPNREALEFVNDRLAPHLDRLGVRCEIRIAGRGIPDLRFHPSVRILGFVPDIYSCIREATLCIVPVRRGIGLLMKVVDSMAVGTPLVVFEFSTLGIPEIRHGVHAYVAATDEEFLEGVAEALSHPQAMRAMARHARHLVEAKFDWDLYMDPLEAILGGPKSVVADGEGRAGRSYHVER